MFIIYFNYSELADLSLVNTKKYCNILILEYAIFYLI